MSETKGNQITGSSFQGIQIKMAELLPGWLCPRCNTIWSPLIERCKDCTSAQSSIVFTSPGGSSSA